MASRVKWMRARFDTVAHAVIEGDVLVLCGAMTRKGPRPAEDFGHVVAAEAVPGMACPDCREIITEAAAVLGVSVRVVKADLKHGIIRSYNDGCRCDECRAAATRHQLARAARAQEASLPGARRRGMVWTGPELETVLRKDLTASDAATMLGRTVEAVLWARKRCRKDPRFARLAGVVEVGSDV